jgi:hypothetical protein
MEEEMKKWDYLAIQIKGKVLGSKQLSDYGAEGWELIQIIESYPTLTGKADKPIRYYIFKRPLK